MKIEQIRELALKIKQNVSRVIVGKDEIIDLSLIALITSGHILLEDVPGMGKTILAKTLARSLNCSFKRIQFTPDLLPSDLTGINYYNQKSCEFQFRPGPVFSNILLADEINRATPRTQSSLLECMEERQVTIDGETRELGRAFLVIATQNPVETQGTFPLPEAQLDRFLFKISMGYPTNDEGIEILKRFIVNNPIEDIKPVASSDDIMDAQSAYSSVHASDDILKYILDIIEKTRNHPDIILGASPRASQALLKACQVHAILKGRSFIIPDDVKYLVKPVLCHRLILKSSILGRSTGSQSNVLDQIISDTTVPSEEKLSKGFR
ncbi:AAA family ATPase [Pseudobacteroides cellulosolvens]|uniref:ATPase associated with various cellular activities AAA_3 n=1 Tax=Pseudobacteroides cellulosolvens ATCC 35603 = DSM 2933 TaxID=398512 RepID=A0A0L6JTV3_9FIRM|nr:MoxR family ATPase [Pseudobacteroides cellulosolvens]KNY29159.1 ATPase associated with various cellular activities AAA_3 [Pseudobacteroides cellulosolvens ATCC 35603 = DSM 2933]